MKMVVGLGNPGSKYLRTRHNIGFLAVERVAAIHGGDAWRERFDGLTSEIRTGDEKVVLLKPMQYMNRSGGPVRKAADFFKLQPEQLLIVCDDFSLPVGKLRLRPNGSSGGQNGLKDIFASMGTDGIARLRIGIGSPEGRDAADYVLSEFSAAERSVIGDAVIDAERAVDRWIRLGIAAAMNEFNGKSVGKE